MDRRDNQRCYAAALEDGGRGLEPRNARNASLRVGEGREKSPLEPQRKHSLPTPWFQPSERHSGFLTPEPQEEKRVLL